MSEIPHDYADRVLGAWQGRCAGSALGAPIELRPYGYVQWKYSKLDGHILKFKKPYVNDDEMYEIVGLMALEEKGPDLTATDIARVWARELYTNMYTAERPAWRNCRRGLVPPQTAMVNNSVFNDYIGAQMRADIWGMVAPGLPDVAAKYAALDASVSHRGDGVNGEIFVAALVSQAFMTRDIPRMIKAALDKVPRDSMYAEYVRFAIDLYEGGKAPREARAQVIKRWQTTRRQLAYSTSNPWRRFFLLYTPLHQVHVLPNAALIVLALLYGEADFGKSIVACARFAYDADCNVGNVGAILGAMTGANNIPLKWVEPLKDTMHTRLRSGKVFKISDLARRTEAQGRRIALSI